MYGEFKRFVNDAINEGRLRPEAVYAPQLAQLEKSLAATDQASSLQQLEVLREGLNTQVRRDLVRKQVSRRFVQRCLVIFSFFMLLLSCLLLPSLFLFKILQGDLKASLEDAILSRYLPESSLIRRALGRDNQLKEAVRVVSDRAKYDALLVSPPGFVPKIEPQNADVPPPGFVKSREK